MPLACHDASMSGPYLTRIDELVDKIRTAAGREPIDWETSPGAIMSQGEARTPDQKAAVERINRASTSIELSFAARAMERPSCSASRAPTDGPRKF